MATTGSSPRGAAELQERLRALGDGSNRIRALSEGLDARIQAFETWIGSLPGRVEATAILLDPEQDGFDFHMTLTRSGSSWRLLYRWVAHRATSTEAPEWSLLKDAGLNTKLVSIDAMPLLVETMEESQTQLLAKLEAANAKFDDFSRPLGIRKEGA